MACRPSEQPEKNAAEQDNLNDDFPGVGSGTGQQDEQDKKRKRIANDVLKTGVQKRHSRNAQQARQGARNQAKRSQIERQDEFQEKHCPNGYNEGTDALDFLLDGVLHGELSGGNSVSRPIDAKRSTSNQHI